MHHDDAGLEDLLSTNDLIRAAEDVLLNEQPLGRVLRVLAENVPPTRHLVLRICNAFDDACDNCTEVQEALAAKQPRTSKSTNLGIVVTKLFGISCSSAYLEKLGKRMSKVQSTMQTTYKKIVKKLDARKAVETKRYKQSGKTEAALEQRLEQLRTATSIEADEFRRKLVDLDCPQEAVEQEAQEQAAAPAAAPAAADAVLAGSRSASSALEAASSLAQLSHHSARAYTCLHCAEHLQARTAARDAADAAQQQAHVAQGLCADAQRDAAEARAEAEKRCAALAQQHELELEDLRSALARAKSRRSDIGKEARKGAEQQRVAAVRARGHQETLAINSHHISMELEGARQRAAAAEQRLAAKVAELKTEQQRRQDDKIMYLNDAKKDAAKAIETIIGLRTRNTELEAQVAEWQSKYRGESTQRGRLAAQLAAAAQTSGGASTRSSCPATGQGTSAATLHAHINSRDAVISELRSKLGVVEESNTRLQDRVQELERAAQGRQGEASEQ